MMHIFTQPVSGITGFILLTLGLLSGLIVGCNNAPAQAPTATTSPTPTGLSTWTPVPTPVPEALFVNPDQTLGPINPHVFGTNYGPWVTVPFDLQAQAEAAGIHFLRFPGGNWGDQNNITTKQIDRYITLAQQMGAEPQITARLRGGTPEQAADLVHYANVQKEYNVRYWSIGNEPSLYDDYDTERYNQEWREMATAMRAVDPNIILIGPDTHQYTGDPQQDPKDENGREWVRAFLEANSDMVDIVAVHRYPFPISMNENASLSQLQANSREWDTIIPNLRNLIRETTGQDLPIAITEVNSHWSKATGGEATPDSFYNAIWWGDVLGRMIEQGVDMVAHFVLQTKDSAGGWGLLARYDVRPSYYTYQMYQHFGNTRIYTSSDDPLVTIYGARRADNNITLMIINLGDTPTTTSLQWANGTPPTETATLYLFDSTHNAEEIGPQPLTNDITLPAQSMSLYLIESNN